MTSTVKSRPDPGGKALIAAVQASPHRDINLEPKRAPMPVREVAV
jgi:hypothetical protein